jgi:uncharacterized damage-inducible protein DinB
MSIAQSLLSEFGQEKQHTRRMLEAVPENRYDWKPHEKSMTLGYLAAHVAQLPQWCVPACTADELDFDPPSGVKFEVPSFSSRAEMLEAFDQFCSEAEEAVADTSDADMMKPWTLKYQAAPLFTLPKIVVLRSIIFNHLIHHRGQLSVYLRLLDQPVPATYGPSADEQPRM